MARDDAALFEIVRAAQLVLELRQGMDRAAFFGDLKTQSGHSTSIDGDGRGCKKAVGRYSCPSSQGPVGAYHRDA